MMLRYSTLSHCPKCSCAEVSSKFIAKGKARYNMHYMSDEYYGAKRNVIERVCQRCKFLWDELPLDEEDIDHANS